MVVGWTLFCCSCLKNGLLEVFTPRKEGIDAILEGIGIAQIERREMGVGDNMVDDLGLLVQDVDKKRFEIRSTLGTLSAGNEMAETIAHLGLDKTCFLACWPVVKKALGLLRGPQE